MINISLSNRSCYPSVDLLNIYHSRIILHMLRHVLRLRRILINRCVRLLRVHGLIIIRMILIRISSSISLVSCTRIWVVHKRAVTLITSKLNGSVYRIVDRIVS